MLGPRGQHAIGLGDALKHQIVDHHADIAVVPVKPDRIVAPRKARCIDAGDKTLGRRFLIAGRAVDLAGQIKARHGPHAKIMAENARIDMIIFDRIAGLIDLDPFKAVDRPQKCELHIDRQRGRYPVGINGAVIQPFRLEKDLMAVAIAKAVDLVFDRRAVARPLPLESRRKRAASGRATPG